MNTRMLAGFALAASLWLAVSPAGLRRAEAAISHSDRAAQAGNVWSPERAAPGSPRRSAPGGLALFAGGLSILLLRSRPAGA